VDQVALAEGAPGEELDGVDAAHVRLDDGDHLLVLGVGPDLVERDLRGAHAQGQPGAHVAMEAHHALQGLGVDGHGILTGERAGAVSVGW
jgi:hypothetical protein